MNTITIREEIASNRINYTYNVAGPWAEAFHLGPAADWFLRSNGVWQFFAGYDRDMAGLPPSIAVIPFLANLVPLAWFYDATIHVDEIDQDFLESLAAVKEGMARRHPNATLGGRIVARNVVRNEPRAGNATLALFSGGVDATYTAVTKKDMKPILVTVWGADIYLKQNEIWKDVAERNRKIARDFGTRFAPIKTSMRSFLNNGMLQERFAKPLRFPNWWYSVQHSIALVGLCAPLAWKTGAGQVIISSSYSVKDDPETKCCNWPDIDGNMRFFGTSVLHHDFAVTRQKKVQALAAHVRETGSRLDLRVCWKALQSNNCCKCEKCARTIYAIIAEGEDPNDMGFVCTDETYAELQELIQNGAIQPGTFWTEVVTRMKENRPGWQDVPHIAAMVAAYETSRLDTP